MAATVQPWTAQPPTMASRSPTHTAVDLNSIGATLLACGDGIQARAAFGATLTLIAQAAGTSQGNNGHQKPHGVSFSPFHDTSSSIGATTTVLRVTRKFGGIAPCREPDRKSFIYNQALVINHPSEITLASLPFYTAVVMFNAGLTFHLATGNGVDVPSLRLASSFYEVAIQHLVQGLKTAENSKFLFAVLLNNMAEVRYKLGEHESCRQLLENLCAILCNKKTMPDLEESELDGFLYNIFCLPRSPLHAPAA